MVLNKEAEWHMYTYFRTLNKLIIKENFPFLVVDDLLDELHCANFFYQDGPSLKLSPNANLGSGNSQENLLNS